MKAMMSAKTVIGLMIAIALIFFGSKAKAEHAVAKQAFKEHIEKVTKTKTPEHDRIVAAVIKYSKLRGLDPSFVMGIIQQESGFNPKAKSFAGAKGLMQVIPKWHPEKIRKRNIYDIETNIDVGTWVLREYMDYTGAYPKAVKRYSGSVKHYYSKVRKYQSQVKAVVAKHYKRHEANPHTDDPILAYLILNNHVQVR